MVTMVLSGDRAMMAAFVSHLKTQNFIEKMEELGEDEGTMRFSFTTNLLKPSLPVVSRVALTTANGQTIELELLRVIETRVDEHTVKVTGTSYDIFAAPIKD